MLVSAVSCSSPSAPQPRETIQLELSSDVYLPEEITERILRTAGPIDIYFWYEGPRGLPKAGMLFMEKHFLEPLLKKPDATLSCYSLSAWDFTKDICTVPTSTAVGEVINQVHNKAIQCIYSSAFFQYCLEAPRQRRLYAYIQETLPKKEQLKALSACYKPAEKTVAAFFMHRPSLFDCLSRDDCSLAYSQMQYVEGYYLIHRAIEKRLERQEKKIQIAFVLPNDESKYYADLSQEIAEMLERDFGSQLAGREVKIAFYCFRYTNAIKSRPYLNGPFTTPDKLNERLMHLFSKKIAPAKPVEVLSLTSTIKPVSGSCAPSFTGYPPRDVLHGLDIPLLFNQQIQERG